MLEKTFTIELPGGNYLEVKARESQGSWWETYEISLPPLKLESPSLGLSGIWKDETVFNFEDNLKIRIPTETLLALINQVRMLATDKETSWWNRDVELHRKVLSALGLKK